MNSKYKKLVNNSLVFAIGNLGSKLMQFIMVPLYSFTLNTEEFGKTDVITTVISLLAPLVSLEIFDAAFRFAMDKTVKKTAVYTVGITITTISSIIIIIIAFCINNLFSGYYVFLDSVLLICTIFYSLISNYVRAIGFSRYFAIAGILNTVVMAIMNVLLLYVLNLGIVGYILSMILGLTISSVYLLLLKRLQKYLKLKKFDSQLMHSMLIYSLPLIPNSLSWWLNSASDRIFILIFAGASANGLYAMASKIPNAITILTNIFNQSWQISAVEEYNSEDAKKFITNVFIVFIYILIIGSIILMMLIKPFFKLLIDSSYYSAWKLTPFILLSLIYSSLSGFLGTIYTATKKTNSIFLTTLYGAIINVIASLVFIQLYGIYGAAIANALSFFVVLVIRYFEIRRDNKIMISWKEVALLHIVYIIYSVFILKVSSLLYTLIFGIIIIIIILSWNITRILNLLRINIKILK